MFQIKMEKQIMPKNMKREKPVKTSREIRNFQTLQQSILISLLNRYADITFKQPAKKSITTQQYMRIKTIKFSEENTINFADFLKRRCSEHYDWDIQHGVPSKTAKRRYQTNKKTDGLHLLMDFLIELGFHFNTKLTEGKMGTIKLENIIEIKKNDKIIVNMKDFQQIGLNINCILNNRMNKAGKEMILLKNDKELNSFILF